MVLFLFSLKIDTRIDFISDLGLNNIFLKATVGTWVWYSYSALFIMLYLHSALAQLFAMVNGRSAA